MQSQVAVLLDEIPAGAPRDAAAAWALSQGNGFWIDRAKAQVRLMSHRLDNRERFYSNRGQLPLPPEAAWALTQTGSAQRLTTVDGHDVVSRPYAFSTYLVSDVVSPGVSEPKLQKVGGTWSEPFVLPVDPELLFQRTGYACMDERQLPVGTVDSENVDMFYDHTAVVEKKLSNVGQDHYTRQPTESCVQALHNHVGALSTSLLFERVPYDPVTAAAYRVGFITSPTAPDLRPNPDDFQSSRTSYRYIHADGCEVANGSVGGTGWRRLLQFTITDQNDGVGALTVAVPTTRSAETTPIPTACST
jgi:hypothetical protein